MRPTILSINENNFKYNVEQIKRYVGENKTYLSKNKRLEILQNAGKGKLLSNEVPAILQKEELVLTKPQQINIADTLLQRSIVPNISMPDYSHLNNIASRNNLQPITINELSFNCTGITGEEAGRQALAVFEREIFGMSNLANQKASITR